MAWELSKRQRYDALYTALEQDRASWDPHWRDLTDYIMPWRGRFSTSQTNDGQKHFSKIIDSTATSAAEILMAGMMSGMTPPSRPWFSLSTPDPALAKFGAVQVWLEDVTQILRDLFLRSNLYHTLPTAYLDIGTFGTSAFDALEDDEDGVRFTPYTLGSYYLLNNAKGRVDGFAREFALTVRQMVEKFGEESLSPQAKSLWSNEQGRQTRLDIRHVILRNPDVDERKLGGTFKRYLSCYYEKASSEGTFLREGGFEDFPVIAPRWFVPTEDTYGRSPGMKALPDVKALQTMHRRKAEAIAKMVNPPLVGPASLQNVRVSQLPGDVTYSDERDGIKGLRALHEVNFQLNPLLEDIREHQERINNAFYTPLFLMLANDERSNITAREIAERHEEKLTVLSPVLERLHDEMMDPLIDRGFSIAWRLGKIPPPPPELQGMPIKVVYESPMAQAQRMVGLGGVERTTQFALNIAAATKDPSALDKLNIDESIEEYSQMQGVPRRTIRTPEQVAAIRQSRAQAQEAAAQAQQAEQLAKAGKAMADSDLDGNNVLRRLVGG